MSYPILYSQNEYKHVPAIAGVAIAGYSVVNDTTEVDNPFQTLGLGVLSDCISCTVTEERNGSYELEMEYSITGIHFKEIQQRCFIYAKPNYLDDPQPFRIYKISKPINKVCTIYARHISYDLSGFEVEGDLKATNASLALELLNQRARGFNISGQVTGSAEFKTDVPSSVRSWFGGKEGSIIDLYGGEWKYDMYNCRLMANRGADRGVTIRYGKNLISLTQEEACSNMYTHVRAFFKDEQNDELIISNLISTGITLEPRRIYFLNCSGTFQEAPTVADLNQKATSYIRANNLSTPTINLTLDFVQMSSFDRVDLCDIVTIIFEELGVSAKAKCIKTKWNVLTDRYDEITLGDAKTTLAGTVSDLNAGIISVETNLERTTNALVQAIDEATNMITGNMGGYVVLHDADEDGFPDEILVMDQPSIETAVKIWRWNKSGLGYSSTGYNGDFGLAMTANGAIVADFITAGTMTANRIRGGALVLGGIDNTDGILQVCNAAGDVLGTWNNTGIDAIAGWIGDWSIVNGVLSTVSGNYTNTLSSQGMITQEHFTNSEVTVDRITRLKQGSLDFLANTTTLLSIGPSYDNANNSYASFKVYKGIYYLPGGGGNVQYRYGGAAGTGTYNAYHYFAGSVRCANSFTVNGTKNRAVETKDYSERLLYSYETPSPMFGDAGEGVIGEDGFGYVWIDPVFAETIDTNQYQVFLQKYGSGDCWIRERKSGYFIVEGTPNLAFGWEIKAKQIDYSQRRLDKYIDAEFPPSTIGEEAANYISELKEGRIA